MSKKRPPIRLSTNALTALKNTYSTEFKERAGNLERIEEYSFSIILYWNRLEAILKILRYHRYIDRDYPVKLDFINRSWSVLRNAHNSNEAYYKLVLGDGGKTTGCLWHTRDRISHANHAINQVEYENYKAAVVWLINQLITNLPSTYELAHKDFLKHKKDVLGNVPN